MIIETLHWGDLKVEEDQVLQFAKGIPGFDGETEFLLIDHEGPFVYLQSVKDKNLIFLLADPFYFYPSYEFELPEGDKEELVIEDLVKVYGIVTLKEEVKQSTINLLAPIVINPEKRLGKQVVLHQTAYQTRHSLWVNHSDSTAFGKEGD